MQRGLVPRRFFSIADLAVLMLVATSIYGVVEIGSEWQVHFRPLLEIDLSIHALPRYTMLSAMRGVVAYLVSLTFTFITGYLAAKSKAAERIILPMLDIGQSMPVLGFLPGLVLGLIALFPNTNFGLELAAILMMFTSQAWNMAFSFYDSIKSVPNDYREATQVIGLSWWDKFKYLELPFAAVPLAWNSLLSMAGGWFFLSVSEAFTLGNQQFRLPGIGAYMAVAVEKGDQRAILAGLVAMVGLIVSMDFFIWRPILSWVQRFRFEEVEGAEVASEEPLMRSFMRESRFMRWVKLVSMRVAHRRRLASHRHEHLRPSWDDDTLSVTLPTPGALQTQWRSLQEMQRKIRVVAKSGAWARGAEKFFVVLSVGALSLGVWQLVRVLMQVEYHVWVILLRNTIWTLLRVFLALVLSTLWTLPVGIWLGTSPRILKGINPVIQVLASFPMPMVFPLFMGVMLNLGLSVEVGSMFLMMLGVQWYILFNVLAGAQRIPIELGYALSIARVPRIQRWKSLYLPCVFPSLVTGWVIAAGGAWNTSIVAEYIAFKGGILQAAGLGSMITVASATKDFPMLAASLTMMVLVVVGFNRTLWAKLYQISQSRYRMDL